jgi:nitroreductase
VERAAATERPWAAYSWRVNSKERLQVNPATDGETILKHLHWRYATKKFDPNKKIPAEEWGILEKTMVLAPSSFGLQPWRFVVVTDAGLRKRLRPAAWDQAQVTEASHLVVFAAHKGPTAADVDRYLKRIVEVRGVPEKSLAHYRKLMTTHIASPGIEHWTARQVYIALGVFLTTAAMMAIDTCPMEGFEPEKVDEILGLSKDGFTAVVLATAGYRAADDKHAGSPKVRFEHGEVVVHR